MTAVMRQPRQMMEGHEAYEQDRECEVGAVRDEQEEGPHDGGERNHIDQRPAESTGAGAAMRHLSLGNVIMLRIPFSD